MELKRYTSIAPEHFNVTYYNIFGNVILIKYTEKKYIINVISKIVKY